MKIIDCDSHYLPEDVYRWVKDEFKQLLPRHIFDKELKLLDVKVEKDLLALTHSDKSFNSHNNFSGLSNINKRLDDLHRMKINKQLLCPQELAIRFNYSVEKDIAVEICKSYNRETKKIIDQYDSFFAVALIPLQNIEQSLIEIEWAKNNNFKGIYIDNIYPSIEHGILPINEIPNIELVFELCEKYNLIVYFHHMMHQVFPYPNSFKKLAAFLPNAIEIGIYSIIGSGILDKFPNLKIIFSEGADRIIPLVYRRIEASFNNKKIKPCQHHPKLYFTKNIYVAIDIENQKPFRFMLENFGSKNILFSTDYPHDDFSGNNKENDANDLINLNLNQTDFENIAYKNAERLFALK
jgi:predicted TIM-barrel fold metal-dependent hydrolase